MIRMRADRREALVDFLLEAVADERTTPFPADVLKGLRRVVRCETVSYWEWSAHELLESSLAADDPASSLRVWDAYPQVRQDDPLPGWAPAGSPLPHTEWLGQTFAISDFLSDRQFRRGALYAEICKPFGVRAVLKVFLPTGAATGASLVFDTTRSRFTETDRHTLQRLVPHLAQLRRNALARGPTRRSSTPPQQPGSGCRAFRHANGSSSPGRRPARPTPRSPTRCSSAPGPSASTWNTSTTSSKYAPGPKRPRSTPKSESS
jgi:hypothetical protein